jgi:Myb/SANT-like DNA-binding domain
LFFIYSASTDDKNAKKLTLLSAIKKDKDRLFGQLSSSLTNNDKIAAWKTVLERAVSLNLCDHTRDYTHVRDKLFGVWKSRALVSTIN